jgi:hypothetical protein
MNGAMRRPVVLALFAGLGLLACTTNVGPDGRAIGGPCVDELDCAAGSYCLLGIEYPGGHCTTNCRQDADCRGGALCVEEEAGVCLLPCTVDEDCAREGYVCRERVQRGAVGTVGVCLGG